MDTGDHKTRDTYNTFQSQTWQILCVLYMSSIVHLSHQERKKVSFFPPSVSEPFIFFSFFAGQTDQRFFSWKKRGIISLFAVGRGFQVTILVTAGKAVESLSILQMIFPSSPSQYFVVNDEDDRLKKGSKFKWEGRGNYTPLHLSRYNTQDRQGFIFQGREEAILHPSQNKNIRILNLKESCTRSVFFLDSKEVSLLKSFTHKGKSINTVWLSCTNHPLVPFLERRIREREESTWRKEVSGLFFRDFFHQKHPSLK